MRLGVGATKDGGTESIGVKHQGIPGEWQPPSGTVTLHGEGTGGAEQQES